MKYDDFSILLEDIFQEIREVRASGQKEYAHDTADVFANFNRISKALKLAPELVLMVYLLKHLDGITAYLDGHTSQREDVRGRIKDALCYLCLLWGMINECEGEIDDDQQPG